MEILRFIMMFIEVVCAFLLIGVILLQKSKGQGMGTAFGGGMGESIFGAQMGNVLTKITVILAVVFLLNTTFLSLMGTRRSGSSIADKISTAPVPGAQQQMPPQQQSAPAGEAVPQ